MGRQRGIPALLRGGGLQKPGQLGRGFELRDGIELLERRGEGVAQAVVLQIRFLVRFSPVRWSARKQGTLAQAANVSTWWTNCACATGRRAGSFQPGPCAACAWLRNRRWCVERPQ